MNELPKEWRCLVNLTEEVLEYLRKKYGRNKWCENRKNNIYYIFSKKGVAGGAPTYISAHHYDFGIEITFEDFKRLVLKENNEIQIQLW